MQEESKRNAILIERFTQEFLNKKKLPYREIRKAHGVCRQALEKSLRENSDVNEIIAANDWIKDLIVNNTLLKIHFFGVLGEMEYEHKKATKIDEPQYDTWGF